MKKIAKFKKEGFVTYYGSDEAVLIPDEYKEKQEELRGVWFSTVANIDIAKMTSVESYKEYLKSVIKRVKEYKMNTVIFQARPTNDAFYKSKLNPWSAYITGVEDKYPGFDVLGFFIEEAKKENIEVHAWINPYRVCQKRLKDLNTNKDDFIKTLSEKNFARKRPDLVIETAETKLILDPSSEEVMEFVSDSVLEIAQNYDVKAVHIDDYFYPYEEICDDKEEEKYLKWKKSDESLSDFRRDNVNRMIKLIHDKLAGLSKKVEFGISPFGIFRTHSKYFEEGVGGWDKGSDNHEKCLQCYDRLYADVYLWMKEKWIDYVVPQVYFDLDNSKPKEEGSLEEITLVKYADLVKWWSGICKETDIKLYIGQAFYRYSDKGNWSNPEEIINQLMYNQNYDNISGTIYFTYNSFVKEDVVALVEARKLLKNIWTKDVKPV